MKQLLFFTLALCAGGLLPIQGVLNAQLGKTLNHPLQATFISFFGAIVVIVFLLIALRPAWPTIAQFKSTPMISFTGGIYGVIFVTAILSLTPHIGIANTLVATIIGQLIVSVVLDHYGLLGLQRLPVNGYRLLGCAGLVFSLYLIQKTG